jgi:hypothetical protein
MHTTAVSAAARRCLAAAFRHRLAAPVTALALTLALALPLAAALARSSWTQRPSGVAVAGTSPESVSLSWTKVPGAAGYDVYANKVRAGSTEATSFTDIGLACGTSYRFGVDSFDADGHRSSLTYVNGATSACGGVATDTTPPSTPANLTGQTTATSLTASWGAATDAVGVTGYDVYLNSTQDGSTQGTTYTISNLNCGTDYTVDVDAFDAAGNHSPRVTKQLTTGACPTPAPSPTTCDLYAAPTGSDTAPGTIAAPFATAQHLADSLSPGQAGCLRGGSYAPSTTYVLNVTRGGALGAPLTIRSYPGERAVLTGIVQIKSGADTVTLSHIDIRGDGTQNTVQIYGSDDTVEYSDLTNNWLGRSCLMLGDNAGAGQAIRPVIRRNTFHECGSPANGSLDHGIYAANVSSGLITENVFWNSAAYAIQLYPNAQNTVFSHNVVDGGSPSVRGGVIFAGSSTTTSNNNTVADNVIAYSVSSNISSWWGGAAGSGNVARDNCVYGGGGGNIAGSGFSSIGNVTADPAFVNRSARDYRLSAGSACLAVVGYDTAALLAGS